MDNKLTFAELQQIFNEIKELEQQLKQKRQLLQRHLLTSTGRECCRLCSGNHVPTWTKHPVLMLHEVFGSYGVGGR
jgi:DNA repair exonuclease SbcCD ATPase subunit